MTSYLGISYPVSFLTNALNTPPPSTGYKLVGLLFYKAEIADKQFKIDALFYKPVGNDFEGKAIEIPIPAGTEKYFKVDGTTSLSINIESDVGQILDYQFWQRKVDFVLFDKDQVEVVLAKSKDVFVTGAEINYGVGAKYNAQITQVATLKMENDNPNLVGNYLPTVIIGTPCPPYWRPPGGGD